jgi:replicative DNA helicase
VSESEPERQKRRKPAERTAPEASDDALRPPQDEAAERALLGAILLDNGRPLQELAEFLQAEDFYREPHRLIYQAMRDLEALQEPVDLIVLGRRLADTGSIKTVGGLAYLSDLVREVGASANAVHYARIVKRKALQRTGLQFSRAAVQRFAGDVDDIETLIDDIASEAVQLAGSGTRNNVLPLHDALNATIDHLERLQRAGNKGLSGVTTGFPSLDAKTSGWQKGNLIILAARPGMGKTAFALNLLINAAAGSRNPTPGVIFSLEMGHEELTARILSARGALPGDKMRSGDISPAEWRRLIDGFTSLKDLRVFIDDTGAIKLSELRRKAIRLKKESGLGFIVIDYLQLMRGDNEGKNTSREAIVSEISRGLKALAKELELPIIALSQLNRAVESRSDRRPQLSDLRESGAIEQDADLIMFLYREEYYTALAAKKEAGEKKARGEPVAQVNTSPDEPGLTELIIAKHRAGATGKVELLFHPAVSLFTSLERDDVPPHTDADAPPAWQMPQARSEDVDYPAPTPQPRTDARLDDVFTPAAYAGDEDPDSPF